jgi:alcohol dehydrogenase, propanol-preferring
MRAYQLTAWQQPPELREVPVPEPGPGEVLIKVGGAGACHSDLHLMDWPAETLPYELPFTLGHENAGWIEALGAGVDRWQVGEAVAVYGPWGCGRCRACRLSKENYCERQDEIGANGGGLGLDGGMADYMLVPDARLLVPLGELDPREAAPLTDAALTPYHAISRSLHLLVPGSTVVVIGIGGLGHMALQILRAVSSSQIIAVDSDEAKLELSRQVGADEALPAGEEAGERIRELTGGRGAELVLDMVGADATLALGAAVTKLEGHIAVIGLAGGGFDFRFGAIPWEVSLSIPYWGSQVELIEVLALARRGLIRPHTERFALADVEQVYRRLRDGEVDGRAVVVPGA